MIPHQSEQNPQWRKVTEHRAPTNTKVIVYTRTGITRIGTVSPGDDTLLWMPLPKLSPELHAWARQQTLGELDPAARLNTQPKHYRPKWLPQ